MLRSLSRAVLAVVWAVTVFDSAVVDVRAQPIEPRHEPSSLLPLEVKWTATLPAAAAAAPVVASGRVFAALHDSWGRDKVIAARVGHLVALSVVDGTELWQEPQEVATDLAVGGGLLYVASGAELRGRDTATGATRWLVPLEAPISAPLVWNTGWLLVVLETDVLLALRAETGGIIWQRAFEGSIRVAPALGGSQVYVSLSRGAVVSLALASGEWQWERKLEGAPQEILPVDDLFVGATDNYFYALARRDGAIKWRWQAGGDIVGRPIVDKERVYFSSLDNVLWALNRSNGVQRWRQPLSSRPTGGPSQADDLLMQGGRSPIVSFFDPIDGTRYAETLAPAELTFPPLSVPDRTGRELLLIMTTEDGQLQAVSPASEPVRLGLAANRLFDKSLDKHYPFDLPRLSSFEIEGLVLSPCMFQACGPLPGTSLLPCMFQICTPTGLVSFGSGEQDGALQLNRTLATFSSNESDAELPFPPLGLSLRWPSGRAEMDVGDNSGEVDAKTIPAGDGAEYTVLAAPANPVTARWLIGRLIDQRYPAYVLGGQEWETRSSGEEGSLAKIQWVHVGDYPSLRAAEEVGRQIERDHLIDWYVVRPLGTRPFSWVW